MTEPGVGPDRLAFQRAWLPEGHWYQWFTGERFGPGEALAVGRDRPALRRSGDQRFRPDVFIGNDAQSARGEPGRHDIEIEQRFTLRRVERERTVLPGRDAGQRRPLGALRRQTGSARSQRLRRVERDLRP